MQVCRVGICIAATYSGLLQETHCWNGGCKRLLHGEEGQCEQSMGGMGTHT